MAKMQASEKTEKKRIRSRSRELWEWIKSLLFAFLLFIVVRTFLFQAFKIPTGSMEDTLLVGDFLLVNKLVYGAQIPYTTFRLPALREPRRGDIVVFKYPLDPRLDYVKRMVGVGGDTVVMRDKVLYVNGEPQAEPQVKHIDSRVLRSTPETPIAPEFLWQFDYLAGGAEAREDYRPTRDNFGPLVVPPGHYFVLGDNRDNSFDSRYWGFVDESMIEGKPLVIYFSKESSAFFPHPKEIRFDRLGDLIQ